MSEVCRIHDTEEVVLLEGLRELEVGSAQELMDVYHSGITHRNTGERTPYTENQLEVRGRSMLQVFIISLSVDIKKRYENAVIF